jgi:hypothetical protein
MNIENADKEEYFAITCNIECTKLHVDVLVPLLYGKNTGGTTHVLAPAVEPKLAGHLRPSFHSHPLKWT